MERRIITDIAQLDNPGRMADQVSGMIAIYNSTPGHEFEMLEKPPEVVIEQLENGLSIVVVDKPENLEQCILFHAALYPNFECGEDQKLGKQVIELGSWIAAFSGQGLGTQGVGGLLELGRSRWEEPLFLSTHKRMAALKVSYHNALEDVDYRDFQYLTFLACTCKNCSEREGHQSCKFRRRTPDVEVIGPDGKIACTLVVSDVEMAFAFEERCREFHSQFGEPLFPGEITVESMARMAQFFEKVKTLDL